MGWLCNGWPTPEAGAMCGRYMMTSPVEALRQLFLFQERPNLMPRYKAMFHPDTFVSQLLGLAACRT